MAPAPGEVLVPVCTACGYSFDGLADEQSVCPECGESVPRFPRGEVFACEYQPHAGRRSQRRTTDISFLLGIVAAFAYLLWRELRRPVPRIWIPVVVCGFVGLCISMPLFIARRLAAGATRARVIVDVGRGRLRFEHCWIHRDWRWPASTGEGLEVGLDEITGVNAGAAADMAILSIRTRHGRIVVTEKLSNFVALAALLRDRVGSRPARPWMLLAIVLAAILIAVIVIQLGKRLGWWLNLY